MQCLIYRDIQALRARRRRVRFRHLKIICISTLRSRGVMAVTQTMSCAMTLRMGIGIRRTATKREVVRVGWDRLGWTVGVGTFTQTRSPRQVLLFVGESAWWGQIVSPRAEYSLGQVLEVAMKPCTDS